MKRSTKQDFSKNKKVCLSAEMDLKDIERLLVSIDKGNYSDCLLSIEQDHNHTDDTLLNTIKSIASRQLRLEKDIKRYQDTIDTKHDHNVHNHNINKYTVNTHIVPGNLLYTYIQTYTHMLKPSYRTQPLSTLCSTSSQRRISYHSGSVRSTHSLPFTYSSTQ